MSSKFEIGNKYKGAVSIVKRLQKSGHETYLVGGWVRDMLLGIVDEETDIDIATACPVMDIPKLFSDCIYVGMAFGVCMVKIKSDNKYFQYDVATFRWDRLYSDGRRPNKIKTKEVSVEEDAKRRDFTINALYYDPMTDKILDFVGGKDDLKKKLIRAVGNPRDRFREDKLRMIRAVRLLYQLNGKLLPELTSLIFSPTQGMFSLEEKTERAIKYLAKELLPAVSYERIWQELDKMSKCPRFYDGLQDLRSLSLLSRFLPETKNWSWKKWNQAKDVIWELPQNTPTLVKIMAFLGTFEAEKVLEITRRFNIRVPNWIG